MPTDSDIQAAALAQQYVADRMGAMQARIDELEAAQQGAGYGALPPAIPASGAHYSAPGAYEGYADYGFPPVMYQRSPYATAAYRTYMSPFGQLGVQPLIGFPSAYPHVIQYPGDNPFRAMGLLDALAGSMWPHWPMAMPQMPRMRMGGGAPAGGVASAKTAPAVQAPPIPMVGNPDVEAQQHSMGMPSGMPARVFPQTAAPVQYTGPIRDANGLLREEAMRRDENTFLGFMSPWFGPDSTAPATNVPGMYGSQAVSPEEQARADAFYNAAVARAQAGQQSIPLPQLAASPPDSALLDAVNSSQQAVLQAAGL